MGNTTGDTTPTIPFWLKIHSLQFERDMVINRFQRQPISDYDITVNDWAFETSKALEILQTSPEDYLKKDKEASTSIPSRKSLSPNIANVVKKPRICDDKPMPLRPVKSIAMELRQATSIENMERFIQF